MDLGARIGWGIVIYAIVFLAWMGVSTYGWTQGMGPYLAVLAVMAVVCIWAGLELRVRTWGDILSYSIGWAVISMALDALYMVPSQGWQWFQLWWVWIGYALVALLPLFSIAFRKKAQPRSAVWES